MPVFEWPLRSLEEMSEANTRAYATVTQMCLMCAMVCSNSDCNNSDCNHHDCNKSDCNNSDCNNQIDPTQTVLQDPEGVHAAIRASWGENRSMMDAYAEAC